MRATEDDFLHLLGIVVIESRRHPETRSKWRAHHSSARSRADQSKLRQIKAQTSCLRSLVDDDVEPVIFHRRVEIFLDGRLQPVDLVDEKHVAFFEACQKSGQLAGLLNHRSTGVFNVHIHRVCDDVSQCCFAQAGRAAEENVLQHVAPLFGRFHHQLQALAHFDLPSEFTERGWPQRDFKSGVWFWRFHLRFR